MTISAAVVLAASAALLRGIDSSERLGQHCRVVERTLA